MSFITTILPKILKWTEILAVATTSIGLLLKILNSPGYSQLLLIGLSTLAATYFYSSYVLIQGDQSKEKKGFTDLLQTILRKVMYIGLSVFWIAFLFAILHLAGANEMMIIGLGTLILSAAFSMILVLGNRERMKVLQSPFIRTVITLLFYFVLPFFR